MGDTIIIIMSPFVLAALWYMGRLQDAMDRKGRRPGESIFSVPGAIRSLLTVETLKFVILVAALSIVIGTLIILDRSGLLG